VVTGERAATLLRAGGEGDQRVTYVELFFDLVYVFAVTQLSHLLLEDLSARGAGRTLLLLLAVWWAWVYNAWFTNWFDPDKRPVRLMMVAVMLAALIMSAALPEAFGERGLYVAGAYVAMQVGRTLFIISALGTEPALRRNFQRILVWMTAAAVLWLAGGFAHGGARLGLWVSALLVDYAAPACGFYSPGLGRSRTTEWTITGGHMAERCHLFLIIALGESILVTGATAGALEPSAATLAAFVVAFIGSVLLWWIYFDRAAEDSSAVIATSEDPGRLGRSAYTYYHLPIVAGVIVTAVADELTIAHPGGHGSAVVAATALGGPALFLAGHALFKYVIFGRLSVPRLAGVVVLAVLAPLALVAPPLLTAAAATLVLAAVARADAVMLRRMLEARAGRQQRPTSERS
jgi:low temperature requirement protein LtrA